MDLETLLRETDPVRQTTIPEADSPMGMRIRDQVAPPRRAVRLSGNIPLVGAFVVMVVVLVLVLSGAIEQPGSAAALTRLATLADHQPTTLGPGQYYYTMVETQTVVIGTGGNPKPFYDYLSGTVQTWVAADGSGRQIVLTDPTPRFYTAADHAAWEADGKPPVPVPPNQLHTVREFGPGSASDVNGPVLLYDISHLPTAVETLTQLIAQGHTGVSTLDQVSACLTQSCTTFERAAALLQGPDIGATPARRAALFEVLANVSGVETLGTITDRAGQSGVGFRLAERVPAQPVVITCEGSGAKETTTLEDPAYVITHEIIVNPQTTTVLSSEQSFSSSMLPTPVNSCAPTQPTVENERLTPSWTIVLGSSVVDSDSSVPAT